MGRFGIGKNTTPCGGTVMHASFASSLLTETHLMSDSRTGHQPLEAVMPVYIILTRMLPQSFIETDDFRDLAEDVSASIKKECPGLKWLHSFATMGSVDVVDVIESDDPNQVARAAMIIRGLAQANTETLTGVPWKDFIASL
jgi:uncharacterized protein with GYD domain